MNKYIASITYGNKRLYLRNTQNPDFLRNILGFLLAFKTREETQKAAERFLDPKKEAINGSHVTEDIKKADEFETEQYAYAALELLVVLLPDSIGDCTTCLEEIADDGEVLGESVSMHYTPHGRYQAYVNLMSDTLFSAIPFLHREQETLPIAVQFKKH